MEASEGQGGGGGRAKREEEEREEKEENKEEGLTERRKGSIAQKVDAEGQFAEVPQTQDS